MTALCSLLVAASLWAQVQRVLDAAPSSFESLKAGNARADSDGNQTWDSTVALLPGRPCAIWRYQDADRYAPSHRCKLADVLPCPRARARFRSALRELSRALGPGWRLEEERNETGIVRTSLRRPGRPVLMVDLVPLPSLRRCDVNLNIDTEGAAGTPSNGVP